MDAIDFFVGDHMSQSVKKKDGGVVFQQHLRALYTEFIALGIEGTKMLLEDNAAIFLFYGLGHVVTNKKVDGIHRFISEVYYIDDRVKLK
jgi:ABC-type transport system substrate-binding protein